MLKNSIELNSTINIFRSKFSLLTIFTLTIITDAICYFHSFLHVFICGLLLDVLSLMFPVQCLYMALCSRVRLEKLTGPQVVKKSRHFMELEVSLPHS
jgi:hypothetical protein